MDCIFMGYYLDFIQEHRTNEWEFLCEECIYNSLLWNVNYEMYHNSIKAILFIHLIRWTNICCFLDRFAIIFNFKVAVVWGGMRRLIRRLDEISFLISACKCNNLVALINVEKCSQLAWYQGLFNHIFQRKEACHQRGDYIIRLNS